MIEKVFHQNNNKLEWATSPNDPVITVPTESGTVLVRSFTSNGQDMLIITSQIAVSIPLVRFHSSCVFGESLHALDCDCGVQLKAAVDAICAHGGIISYAWEEGRGIGIINKIRAIRLEQEQDLNTAEAFKELGHSPEPRDFSNHVAALKSVFNGKDIKLASANPTKIQALEEAGFNIVERVKLEIPMNDERSTYISGKKQVLAHL